MCVKFCNLIGVFIKELLRGGQDADELLVIAPFFGIPPIIRPLVIQLGLFRSKVVANRLILNVYGKPLASGFLGENEKDVSLRLATGLLGLIPRIVTTD